MPIHFELELSLLLLWLVAAAIPRIDFKRMRNCTAEQWRNQKIDLEGDWEASFLSPLSTQDSSFSSKFVGSANAFRKKLICFPKILGEHVLIVLPSLLYAAAAEYFAF